MMRRWPSASSTARASRIGSRHSRRERRCRPAPATRRRRRRKTRGPQRFVPVAMAPEAGSSQYQELPDLSQPVFMTPELFMWNQSAPTLTQPVFYDAFTVEVVPLAAIEEPAQAITPLGACSTTSWSSSVSCQPVSIIIVILEEVPVVAGYSSRRSCPARTSRRGTGASR